MLVLNPWESNTFWDINHPVTYKGGDMGLVGGCHFSLFMLETKMAWSREVVIPIMKRKCKWLGRFIPYAPGNGYKVTGCTIWLSPCIELLLDSVKTIECYLQLNTMSEIINFNEIHTLHLTATIIVYMWFSISIVHRFGFQITWFEIPTYSVVVINVADDDIQLFTFVHIRGEISGHCPLLMFWQIPFMHN